MRLNSVALLSLVATALAAKAPFKIDFEVRRGESKDDLSLKMIPILDLLKGMVHWT